jgi:hypothetical protein
MWQVGLSAMVTLSAIVKMPTDMSASCFRGIMEIRTAQLSAAFFAAFLFSNHATAAPVERASIEGLDVDPGETELELQTSFRDGNDIEFQLQPETRLSKALSIGGEFEASRGADERLVADTLLVQAKLHLPTAEASRFGAAVRFGAGYDFEANRPLVETVFFAGFTGERVSLSTRFGVEALLGRSASPETDYRIRLERDFVGGITAGIEAAGDITADDAREHRIGPIVSFPLGGDDAPSLELGAFKGLSSATPDTEFRIELEFEF